MGKAKSILQKKRYKIREEDGNLFAEKGRFSRWGAYVNHTGLIIVMIGAMLRFFPGMYLDTDFWVREGATQKVPGTNGDYYIKNHKFIFEQYDKNDKRYAEAVKKESGGPLAKNYQSDVTLYKQSGDQPIGAKPDLKKVKDDAIKVNHPLEVEGYGVYQVDYKLNELSKMSFQLENKKSKKAHGTFSVDLLGNQKSVYKLDDGYKAKLLAYFPDFYFNDKDEPATKTSVPNNPAFIFKMFTPDKPKGETSFIGIKENADIKGPNDYKLTFQGLDTKNLSAFTVHKDNTLWIIIIGGILFMIGVVQGLYWQYRRIWLKRKDGEIWFAGTTNKNWYGLKKDMSEVSSETELNEPVDKLDDKD